MAPLTGHCETHQYWLTVCIMWQYGGVTEKVTGERFMKGTRHYIILRTSVNPLFTRSPLAYSGYHLTIYRYIPWKLQYQISTRQYIAAAHFLGINTQNFAFLWPYGPFQHFGPDPDLPHPLNPGHMTNMVLVSASKYCGVLGKIQTKDGVVHCATWGSSMHPSASVCPRQQWIMWQRGGESHKRAL